MRFIGCLFVYCLVLCMVAVPSARAESTTDAIQSEWVEKGRTESACSAQVTCWNGSQISCSGSSTCTATDGSCPLSRGRITCDGTTTYCPYCPPGQCPYDEEPCLSDGMCRGSSEPPCSHCYCEPPYPYSKSTEGDPIEGKVGVCVCP